MDNVCVQTVFLSAFFFLSKRQKPWFLFVKPAEMPFFAAENVDNTAWTVYNDFNSAAGRAAAPQTLSAVLNR
nr:hypothetical protein [uncultured Oscillibacter sp.]